MRTRSHQTRAVVAGALCALTLASCAPEPIRRARDEGPTVAPAVSVSPELPREPATPDAEPAVSSRQAPAEPRETALAPPPRPAPAEPVPATAVRAQPPADWWLHEPDPEPGRLRMVVSSTAGSLREARRAAVDEGLRQIQHAVGAPPANLRYELTTVQRDSPGVYRGYVLISCDAE